MEKTENKLRPLALAKIFYERTDEDHYLTTHQLQKILDEEYNLPTHRTTISDDVELLQRFGIDIQVIRSSQSCYNLVSRNFDYAELKLLIDAVASSKFISKTKSESLTERIAAIGGMYRADELKRNISVERRIKAENGQVLNIIDRINDAINQNKRIRFQYFEYTVQKKRVPKHDGEYYELSPYRLIWNGDYYYVVGFSEKHGKVASFRVDRMVSAPEITEENAIPMPDDFDIDVFLNSTQRMFGQGSEMITLLCENSTMNAIIDRFGEDVKVTVKDESSFFVRADVAVNKNFFAWIFGFEEKVRIFEPESAKKDYEDMVKRAYERITESR